MTSTLTPTSAVFLRRQYVNQLVEKRHQIQIWIGSSLARGKCRGGNLRASIISPVIGGSRRVGVDSGCTSFDSGGCGTGCSCVLPTQKVVLFDIATVTVVHNVESVIITGKATVTVEERLWRWEHCTSLTGDIGGDVDQTELQLGGERLPL